MTLPLKRGKVVNGREQLLIGGELFELHARFGALVSNGALHEAALDLLGTRAESRD